MTSSSFAAGLGRLGLALALTAMSLPSVLSVSVAGEGPAPSVGLDPCPEYTSAHAATFTGTAAGDTSPIAGVEYRVDHGPWLQAVPVDGAFGDSTAEAYTFTTDDLDDGWHAVDIKATTKAGYTTPPEDYATALFCVDTVPPTISITPLSPDPSADSTPSLSGTAEDSTSPIAAVEYRVDGGQWFAALAADGSFDSPCEAHSFTTFVARQSSSVYLTLDSRYPRSAALSHRSNRTFT